MAAFAHKWRSNFSCFSRYFTNTSIKLPAHVQFLIDKYHFTPQTASKSSSFLRNPQRTDSILSFLKQTGFSDSHLEKIARYCPHLVFSILDETIKLKIKSFQDLGFSAVQIVAIVGNDPSILSRNVVNGIIPSLSVLKSLLGSNVQVTKFLTNPSWSFRLDLKKSLLPNIELLKKCGVSEEQINSLLLVRPNFFIIRPENMRRCVDKVDEMGVDRSSKLFIYAVQVVSSMSDASWELKLKTFRDLGFSEDGVVRVFRTSPTVLAVSRERIKKVVEVLLKTGKYDMSCIINCPTSLMYSVEKRYEPRLRVLEDLEKKGLISKWPSLATLSRLTESAFFRRFVALSGNEVRKDGIAVAL